MKKLLVLFLLSVSFCFAQAATSTAVVPVGKTILMEAKSDGTAPFSYVWQVVPAGSAVAKTLSSVAGTFTLNNVQMTDAGVYTCTVKNSAGQAVGTANLTITSAGPTTVTIVITVS